MKKCNMGLLIAACILLSTGCTNMKQVDRITFITALGIDKSESGVKVYALAAIPGRYASLAPGVGGSPSKPPNYILEAEGRDIAEALFVMKRKSARDIEFGHTKVFVFSDKLAKQGLEPSMDLLMRRTEFQPVSWLIITKGSVKPLLATVPEAPETMSDALADIFSQSGSDTSEVLPIYMFEFYGLSVEPGQSPYIMMAKDSEKGNKIEMTDLALFKKDRMIGTIRPEETKILQLLQKNKLRSTSFTAGDISFTLLDYSTKIKVKPNLINIRLQLELEIDQNQKGEPLNTSRELNQLEQQLNDSVQQEIKQLISKLQGLKADPAGFGNYYRTAVSGGFMKIDEWEDDIFPKMSIDVKVSSKIQKRGTIK